MIFKCGLCEKYKMGKHNDLKYRALNEHGIPEDYVMTICEVCTDEFQKANIEEDQIEASGDGEL